MVERVYAHNNNGWTSSQEATSSIA